jgi:hypothetical protein
VKTAVSNPPMNADAQAAALRLLFVRRLWAVRVCQAWHRTSEVKVLAPGSRGAEG